MAIDVGSAVGYLDLDTTGFSSGVSKSIGELKVLSSSTASVSDKFKAVSTSLTGVGSNLTTHVTAPLALMGAGAVAASAKFEAGMSEVKAISRATSDEMVSLKEKALEMGAKTKYSASESADAFKYMAQAGWTASDMIDGIEGVMSLAAASGEDLALTSSIVTDSLTAFGLSAKDAAEFSDVLAMAANATNTGVAELGEAFKYIAPVAGAMNYSIQDVSVALGEMANSGIKASTAGTSLRALLTNLAKPTDKMAAAMEKYNISLTDSNGEMLPLQQLLEKMRDSFSGLAEDQKLNLAATLAGKEGMSGLLAIVNASENSWVSLSEQINNASGSAKDAAAIMQDNLAGTVEQLGGSAESLAISVGDILSPKIREIAEAIGEFTDKLNKMSDAQKEQIVKVLEFVAVLGPALLILGKTIATIKSMITFIGTLKAAIIALKTGVALTTPEFTALLTVGGAVLAVFTALAVSTKKARNEYSDLTDASKDLVDETKTLNDTIGTNIKNRQESATKIDTETGAYKKLTDQLYELNDKTSKSNEDKAQMISLVDQLNQAMPDLNLSINEQTGLLSLQKDEVYKLIQANEEYYKVKAAQEDLVNIAKEQYEAEKKQTELKQKQTELTNALAEAEQKHYASQYAMDRSTKDLRDQQKSVNSELEATSENMKKLDTDYDKASQYIADHSDAVDSLSKTYTDYGDTVDDTTETVSEDLQKLTEDYEEAVSERTQEIEKSVGLFDEFNTKSEQSGKKLLENLESQVKGMTEWADNLKSLAKKGVDEGLIKELEAMGPEAAGQIAELNKLSEPELAKYVELWRQKSELAKTEAIKENENLKTSITTMTESLNTELNAQFEEVGYQSMQGYKFGIMSGKTDVLQAIMGVNTNVVEATKQQLLIHSPSVVFQQIGEYIDEGLAKGILKKKTVTTKAMQEIADALTNTADAISTGLITYNSETDRLIYSSTYTMIMKKINLYYKDRDKRVAAITKGTQASIDAIEDEVDATRAAYETKVKLYEQELKAKQALVDNAASEKVKALQAEIDAIDAAREADARKAEDEEYLSKKAELAKQYDAAETEEEKTAILKEVTELQADWEKTILERERSDKQEALRQQIEDVEAAAEDEKTVLEDEYNAKIYMLEQEYNAEVEHLNAIKALLEQDYKYRQELEEVQTELKKKQNELQTSNLSTEQKKQTQNEITELKTRETELKASIEKDKKTLTDSTKDFKTIGDDFGEALYGGFKSKDAELKSYLSSLSSYASSVLANFKSTASAITAQISGVINLGSGAVNSGLFSVNGSYANGLDYVPYDGFRAELHEGEKVLTKQQAQNEDKSSGDTYNFYSPKALDPAESARQMKKAHQEIALGFN